MADNERNTIWGTFPMPDREEISQAWNQIARRTNNTAAMEDRIPQVTDVGERVREFIEVCPVLDGLVPFLAKSVAESLMKSSLTAEEQLTAAYGRGANDMLELLGTIALNRQAEEILPDLPDFPDEI